MFVETRSTLISVCIQLNMSDSGDIENNELIKNDLIEQLDKYKRSRTSYLGKITQNKMKIERSKFIKIRKIVEYLGTDFSYRV